MAKNSLIGKILAGRFRVVDVLGTGSMADVYLAEHTDLDRKFAIKVLKEQIANDGVLVERFRREARTTSRLDHPNIVQIADFGRTEDGQIYLVMEHIPGSSLRATIDSFAPRRMPLVRSLGILSQITCAVAAAHEEGIIHRDLKPANVLLGQKPGGGDLVKILDFGLAKIMAEAELEKLTKVGEIFGTPAYMSPEQGRGVAMDHRTDLYSLGIIAYELCAGRVPFVHNNIPDTLMAHQDQEPAAITAWIRLGEEPVPIDMERMILACLEKDPDRRPQQAQDLLDVIDGHLKRLPRFRTAAPTPVEVPTEGAPDGDPAFSAQPSIYDTVLPTQQTQVGEASLQEQEEQGRRQWQWINAVKHARALARRLMTQSVYPTELRDLLNHLGAMDRQMEELGTEIALGESGLEDVETAHRDREAMLRYAVVDLSIQSARLADQAEANPNAAEDLAFQIQSLEQRLVEGHQAFEAQQHRLAEELMQSRDTMEELRQEQIDVEVHLVNLLQRIRPTPCPPTFESGYHKLAESLHFLQTDPG